MELFTMINDLPHVRVGKQWVPLMDVVGLLDNLIDHEHQQPGETARHALARVNLDWHRTGKLPHGGNNVNTQRHSIGRDKAIELADSHWWELCSSQKIAEFQMFTAELCCPFGVFHKALEEALGRPVWTHELGLNFDGIAAELIGHRAAPTFEEIMNLIPEEKRIIVSLGELPQGET